jgi:Tol biopolymer transport system component
MRTGLDIRCRRALAALPAAVLAAACANAPPRGEGAAPAAAPPAVSPPGRAVSRPSDPRERHLTNLRQLTDGGENAEAYFSFDGSRLIFQSTRAPYECDQIFTMDLGGGALRMLSTGLGRTTCAYYLPDGRRYLYASTHLGGPACPPKPDMSQGYVWALYDAFDIFTASLDDPTPHRLTATPGYDAEATVSPRGDRVVFTSVRDGDIELYTMNLDGSDVRRVTHEAGYDGGAFFSPDGTKLVWRASRPQPGKELDDFRRLLAQGLVRPSKLDIYVAEADGTGVRRLTDNGAANFAPYFHPSGAKVIFCSNVADPRKRNFELFLVNLDGSGLEQVTYYEEFDGFPMWAPDGRTFVFCSNRHNSAPNETNVYVADWVD